jgi:hypothetical protein
MPPWWQDSQLPGITLVFALIDVPCGAFAVVEVWQVTQATPL